MTDIFRSAFQYLSQAGPNLLSSSSTSSQSGGESGQLGRTDHPLVGSLVEIGPNRYRIRSLLAEGGYALVFAVQEQRTGQWLALKRQLAADREAADAIRREIKFLRELSGHASIIEFVEASQLGPKQSGHGRAEFLLLTELCSGSTLINVLQKKTLSAEQVCKIFHSACEAVRHMHDRSPPITHRDIKIENLLFSSACRIKLCDFGSATTDVYRPNDDWNALRRGQLEEEMARHTTPMYRAPEILDTYQNYPIGPPQDVWALGCILYYLCYRQHPFEDSAKLRILNAKYGFPPAAPDSEYTIFHQLIQSTLQPNPYSRPSIQDLCERVDDLAFTLRVDLSEPILGLDLPPPLNSEPSATINSMPTKTAQVAHDWPSASSASPSSTRPPHPSSPLPSAAGIRQESQPPAGEVISQLKGQGLSLFKNLRDKGQQLAQSVLSTSGANDVVPSGERVPPTNCLARDISDSHEHGRASPPPRPPRHRPDPAQKRAPAHVERRHEEQLTTVGDGEMAGNEFDPFETCFPCRDGDSAERREVEKCKAEEEKEELRLEQAQNHQREAFWEQSNQPQPPPRLASSQRDLPTEESKLEREKVRDEDLLGGWTYANSDRAQLHPPGPRHVSSAPSFPTSGEEDLLGENDEEEGGAEGRSIDPLSELLASCLPAKGHAPSYSRKHFRPDDAGRPHSQRDKYPTFTGGTTGVRLNESTFIDLLSSHGFSNSGSGASIGSSREKRTLADLRREEMAKEMDPVSLKIADWTKGKEKNIRALLSSLHEVLWDDIGGNWSVPTMSDLLSNNQIKKNYYKACLVVHPDKQVGTNHELLAKAIFTELNDAWNKFDEERRQ